MLHHQQANSVLRRTHPHGKLGQHACTHVGNTAHHHIASCSSLHCRGATSKLTWQSLYTCLFVGQSLCDTHCPIELLSLLCISDLKQVHRHTNISLSVLDVSAKGKEEDSLHISWPHQADLELLRMVSIRPGQLASFRQTSVHASQTFFAPRGTSRTSASSARAPVKTHL